jgi:hypothetical protein
MKFCNEWKREKRHEYTNTAQLQTTRIKMAAVADVVKMAAFTSYNAA